MLLWRIWQKLGTWDWMSVWSWEWFQWYPTTLRTLLLIILSHLELIRTPKTQVPSAHSPYLLITSKISNTKIWAWPKSWVGPNCALVTIRHHISSLHITLNSYLVSKSQVPYSGIDSQMRHKWVTNASQVPKNMASAAAVLISNLNRVESNNLDSKRFREVA